MARLFRAFDRVHRPHPFARLRRIPLRMLAPNLVTLATICLGLSAIRMGADGRLEWAVGAIVAAAALDGVDGRLARWLKGTSRFGAELDSLADFVNFGVAPALILYFWDLHNLRNFGWFAVLLFAIASALRLARFNVMLEDPTRPAWQGDFFVGVPAPAGAIIVLLPMYLAFLGMPVSFGLSVIFALYTLAIGGLMVSRVPTFSGKKATSKVPREMVLVVIVALVAFFALLASFPWEVLTGATVAYLAALPLGVLMYRRMEMKYAAENADAAQDVPTTDEAGSGPTPSP